MTHNWNRRTMGESLFSQEVRANEDKLVRYGKFDVMDGTRKMNRVVYFYKGEKVAKLNGFWESVRGCIINDKAYFRF